MNGQSAAKAYKTQIMIKQNSIYNKVKVIDFAYAKESRAYYNTVCLTCNVESIRRIDHIKTNPEYCKHCKNSLSRTINTESVINTIYGGYKSNAKQRNMVFKISKQDFLNIACLNCFYCSQEPIETQFSKSANRSTVKFLHNGVDRLDSKKGYVLDNCVPCCGMCNLMKNKFSLKDFLNKIKKIYEYKQCSTTMP